MENYVYFGGQTSHTCVILDALYGQPEFQSVPTWIHVLFYHLRRKSLIIRQNLNFAANIRSVFYLISVLVVACLLDNAYL